MHAIANVLILHRDGGNDGEEAAPPGGFAALLSSQLLGVLLHPVPFEISSPFMPSSDFMLLLVFLVFSYLALEFRRAAGGLCGILSGRVWRFWAESDRYAFPTRAAQHVAISRFRILVSCWNKGARRMKTGVYRFHAAAAIESAVGSVSPGNRRLQAASSCRSVLRESGAPGVGNDKVIGGAAGAQFAGCCRLPKKLIEPSPENPLLDGVWGAAISLISVC